jgi:hypothetical protein
VAICFCFLTASGGAIFSEKLENKIKACTAAICASYLSGLRQKSTIFSFCSVSTKTGIPKILTFDTMQLSKKSHLISQMGNIKSFFCKAL